MELELLTGLCGSFYSTTRIPLGIFSADGTCLHVYPDSLETYPFITAVSELKDSTEPVTYFSDDSGLFFSMVRLTDSENFIVYGPSFSAAPDNDALRTIMRNHLISSKQFDQMETLFYYIPRFSNYRFLSTVALLQYMLTGVYRKQEMFPVPNPEDDTFHRHLASSTNSYTDEQNNNLWISYHSEQAFFALADNGDVEGSLEFISKPDNFISGVVASDPFRQNKNIAIIIIALLARHAIRAGVNIRTSYQMSDAYIQEIERTGKLSHVSMILRDAVERYVQKIKDTKVPTGISPLVYQCVQFAGRCVNENINVEDVAENVGKSSSYISAVFKREMGVPLGSYIVKCKIDEAQRLLRFTDKSLVEISDYLCFSSQSYFQNVFKKLTGTTPQKYRNSHR